MQRQGLNSNGEPMSSVFVEIDRDNPDIVVDMSDEPSLTRQEFAAECDINTLMAQYDKTGVINHFNRTPPAYMDLTNTPDLQMALLIMEEARVAFMTLPATVRREFDNDPAKFVEFAQNPDNIDKLREWNLAAPLPVDPPPQKVEIVNKPDDKSDA